MEGPLLLSLSLESKPIHSLIVALRIADLGFSQPFWGDMVAKAGAGPRPIPHANLTAENLAEALQYLVSKEAATAAESLASKMQSETGVQAAARSFHRQLPLEHIQCQVLPAEPAVWTYLKSDNRIRLSKVAAETLLSAGKVTAKELKMSVQISSVCLGLPVILVLT